MLPPLATDATRWRFLTLVDTLVFTREGERTLRLSGELAGAKVEALCERLDAKDFLLVNRGFHRVKEFPFNR